MIAEAEALLRLLARKGERAEARHAYTVAIGLDGDAAVRQFLQRRQAMV